MLRISRHPKHPRSQSEGSAFLFQAPREQENQLLIREALEGSNRKIHCELAAVVALECDRHARRLHPAIRKTSGPRGFERAPVKTRSISETTHQTAASGCSRPRREATTRLCKGLTVSAASTG